MKTFEKIVLAVGLATLALLLWKMDAHEVGRLLSQVGWGFLLIIGQESGAHVFNTLGWRFCFDPELARAFSFGHLYRLRVVGDSVNYLTPSATIAGEVTRASALDNAQPAPVRAAGVVVAKCAQTLAQALFILFGLATVVHGKIAWLAPYEGALRGAAALCAAGLAGLAAFELLSTRKRTRLPPPGSGAKALLAHMDAYFRRHPGRCALAILLFIGGYVWGAFEAYWICRFLGAPVAPEQALAIEVLSIFIDGLLFMVPAKVGTQEAGKTAVFAALGLDPRTGFAFGVVRHVRELCWAGFGMLLYKKALRR